MLRIWFTDLMISPKPLVSRHLLMHFLLEMLLLLSLHYWGRPDCCKVFRINGRLIRIKIWTNGKFSWIDLKRKQFELYSSMHSTISYLRIRLLVSGMRIVQGVLEGAAVDARIMMVVQKTLGPSLPRAAMMTRDREAVIQSQVSIQVTWSL